MERIKFYFDEHVPQAVADGLRRRGVDVLIVQAAGRSGLPDDEQLVFAFQQRRVLMTMDSDYLILAAQGMSHAGIAYAKPGTRSISQVERQAAVEVLLSFVLAALQQPRESAFRPGNGLLRFQLDGSAEVSLGPFQIASGFPERSAIEPGLSIARRQRNRLVEISQRAVEISFHLPHRVEWRG